MTVCQTMFRSTPKYLMDQDAPHSGDIGPRNLRRKTFAIGGQVPNGFADHLEVADDGVDGLLVGPELLESQAIDVLLILAIASRMSSTRRRQSLGGNNRLAKNFVAKLWFEGCQRDEIDLVTNELAELPLQSDELKEADRPAELDEEINVAVLLALIAGERTEEGQTGNTEGVQHGTVFAQHLQDVVAPGCRVDRHGSGLIIAETAEGCGPGLLGPVQAALKGPPYILKLVFVDTVWTNGAQDYAESRVNTRVSASDLFRRRALLTPFRSNEIRSGPWLVRNAEVASSSLASSTRILQQGGSFRCLFSLYGVLVDLCGHFVDNQGRRALQRNAGDELVEGGAAEI